MADHKYPLQMEALALAVESMSTMVLPEELGEVDVTKMILTRASAFLGWAQASHPSHREPNPYLRPSPKIMAAMGEGDPLEGPVR